MMKKGSDTLHFTYDATGTPTTVTHNGTVYYYVTNLQGDVVKIIDSTGTTVATYTYDAWGNPTGTIPTTGIGYLNPLRYRGYVYDTETGLYYLQSRYYNPEIGRFISADIFISTGQGFVGNNMFAYCGNNPVNMIDPTGTRHEIYSGGGFGTTTDVQSIRFSDIFGYGTSLSQNYDIISAETFFFDSESGYSTSKVISGDISKPISFYCENASDWWNVNEYKAGIKFNTKSGGFSIAEGPGETSVVIAYDQKSLEILVGLNKMGYTVRDDVDFGSGTAGFYHHGYIRTIPTVGAAAVVAALIFTASGLPAALAFA